VHVLPCTTGAAHHLANVSWHVLPCVQAGATPQQQQPPPAAAAAAQQKQQLAGTKRPAASLPGGSNGVDGAAAAADAAVPKGFFDDKTADKKARGIKE
jgi:hypothetical protein